MYEKVGSARFFLLFFAGDYLGKRRNKKEAKRIRRKNILGGTTDTVTGRVEEFIAPLLADMGVELVEIQYRREGHGWVLRLFIDREGGVTLEDCAGVSREVSRYLEVEDPIEHAYTLEVSSPGLERPLKKKDDFIRFVGRRARIKMREKRDDQRIFIGTLQAVEGEDVLLQVDDRLHHFPLADISRARLILE